MSIEIIHGDATELDASDFACFDSMLVDPPYSEYVHSNAASNRSGGAGPVKRDFGFASLSDPLRAALALGAANVGRWSVIFSDHESTHLWRDAIAAQYIRPVPVLWSDWGFELPWVRWSQPQLSGDRPPSGSEMLLHWHHKGAKHWNGPGSLTHYSARCMRGKEKHKAEKPLDLMLSLVSWYSDPGQSVIDPTCGRGTTVLAARLLERCALGLELDAEEARRASARVKGRTLSARDQVRAEEWVAATIAEAERTPTPTKPDDSDVKTWQRAQRRIADARTVARNIKC